MRVQLPPIKPGINEIWKMEKSAIICTKFVLENINFLHKNVLFTLAHNGFIVISNEWIYPFLKVSQFWFLKMQMLIDMTHVNTSSWGPQWFLSVKETKKFEGLSVICVIKPNLHAQDYYCPEGERQHEVNTHLLLKVVVANGLRSVERT